MINLEAEPADGLLDLCDVPALGGRSSGAAGGAGGAGNAWQIEARDDAPRGTGADSGRRRRSDLVRGGRRTLPATRPRVPRGRSSGCAPSDCGAAGNGPGLTLPGGGRRTRLVAAGVAVALAVSSQPDSGVAQEPPDSPPQEPAADSAAPRPGPAGAFLRGALVPGWGHTVSGAHARGAFYFGVESLAGWMLFKTIRRLGAAREAQALWEKEVSARLEAAGVSDPEELAAALEAHEEVAGARGLVAAREEQREDWVAVAIFTLLISGVDAFVSAHLQDFPQPLVEPGPGGGGVAVGLRLPVG